MVSVRISVLILYELCVTGIHLGHPEYCQAYAKAEDGEAGLEAKLSDNEFSEDDDSDSDY